MIVLEIFPKILERHKDIISVKSWKQKLKFEKNSRSKSTILMPAFFFFNLCEFLRPAMENLRPSEDNLF